MADARTSAVIPGDFGSDATGLTQFRLNIASALPDVRLGKDKAILSSRSNEKSLALLSAYRAWSSPRRYGSRS